MPALNLEARSTVNLPLPSLKTNFSKPNMYNGFI